MVSDIDRAHRRMLKMWAKYYGVPVRWWNLNCTIRKRLVKRILRKRY